MGLYDRILVPTDGSTASDRALRHAVELAAIHDAAIDVIYVLDTAAYAGLPMETAWEGVGDLLREDAEEALETAREVAADADVELRTELLEGRPNSEIVRYADAEGCDLIVMGTHGRGGIDRLLLGSVTEKVVRAADVPVTTIRASEG